MSDFEFHCPRCGSENEIEQRKAGRFTTDFGWPIYETRYVCPNKRLIFDGHSRTRWHGRAVDPKYETGWAGSQEGSE